MDGTLLAMYRLNFYVEGRMLDIRIYTDYVERLAGTWFGKTLYSVGVGAVGTVILAVFLAGMMRPTTLEILLPIIIGFNAALTGYMAVEKSRHIVRRQHLLAMGSGIVMVLLATIFLNIIFFQWAGFILVGLGTLVIMLVVGLIASGLGGKLCAKYLELNRS
jgi:hypothetical protein